MKKLFKLIMMAVMCTYGVFSYSQNALVGAPQNIKAIAIANTIKVSWDAPLDVAGYTIRGYRAEAYPNGAYIATYPTSSCTTNDKLNTTCTITPNDYGSDTYPVNVRALTLDASGGTSYTAHSVTVLVTISRPTPVPVISIYGLFVIGVFISLIGYFCKINRFSSCSL